jgi:hypothetical protein
MTIHRRLLNQRRAAPKAIDRIKESSFYDFQSHSGQQVWDGAERPYARQR